MAGDHKEQDQRLSWSLRWGRAARARRVPDYGHSSNNDRDHRNPSLFSTCDLRICLRARCISISRPPANSLRIRTQRSSIREAQNSSRMSRPTPLASVQQVLDRGFQLFGILGPVAIDFQAMGSDGSAVRSAPLRNLRRSTRR